MKSDKPHKYPAMIHLSEEELPEIKGWKVGSTYDITLKVKQTSVSLGDEMMVESKGKPKMRASFEIVSARPLGGDNTTVPKRGEHVRNSMENRIKY